MKRLSTFIFYGIIFLFLSSCLSTRFSTENIMKLKTHMSSDEIIKMFGEPEGVRSSICGGKNGGEKWRCTFWKYGDYSSGRASFTFYEKEGKLYLNSYDIDR